MWYDVTLELALKQQPWFNNNNNNIASNIFYSLVAISCINRFEWGVVRCHVGAGRVTAGPGKKTPQTVRRQNISCWVLLQDVVMLFIILASPKHLLVFMKARCMVSKKNPSWPVISGPHSEFLWTPPCRPGWVFMVRKGKGGVNCPTQPTCLAHFDLCICVS